MPPHNSSAMCLVLVGAVALWLTYRRFFMRRSLSIVPGPPPVSLLKGNLPQLFDGSSESLAFHEQLATQYGSVVGIQGFLWDKHLYITDPLALHHIIVKELYVFEQPDYVVKSRNLLVGNGILSSHGVTHAKQRKFLNPVFSIAHMRNLLPIFHRIVHELRDIIRSQVAKAPAEIDMLDVSARVALELIGQAGLGYGFDAFNDRAPNNYRDAIKHLLPAMDRLAIWRQLLPYFVDLGPSWLRRLIIERIPIPDIQAIVTAINVMDETSRTIWKEKKEAHDADKTDQLVGGGKDLMSLMLQASISAGDSLIAEDELIAQMSTLIFAGQDTTSTAISSALHYLSLHPDAQQRLRKEVQAAMSGTAELSYDELMALPYLDAITRETLRCYAPVVVQARVDTVVPLANPIHAANGKIMTELFIPKGTTIYIGIRSANMLETMWGHDYLEWKPERWMTSEPPIKRENKYPGVYSSMMTFLGGGRACIGFKFALMELKLVLATLISSFKFSPSKEATRIEWRGTTVTKPFTSKDASVPSLPLIVEAVGGDS